jgi:hypothetical protein
MMNYADALPADNTEPTVGREAQIKPLLSCASSRGKLAAFSETRRKNDD